MKHIMFADKSLLVDDEAADLLIEFASMLANSMRSDTVTLAAIGQDGEEVEVSFLLDSGTNLVIQTTSSTLPPPDNSSAISHMRERIEANRNPSVVAPEPFEAASLHDYDT
jgi:hypothetical protein